MTPDTPEMVEISESFTTNHVHLKPDTKLEATLVNDGGTEIGFRVSNIRHNPDDPEFLTVTARAEVPVRSGRFIVDKEATVHKGENIIRVGSILNLDPEAEHKGLKSKKLWAAIGGVAAVSIAGIAVTRKILRARRG